MEKPEHSLCTFVKGLWAMWQASLVLYSIYVGPQLVFRDIPRIVDYVLRYINETDTTSCFRMQVHISYLTKTHSDIFIFCPKQNGTGPLQELSKWWLRVLTHEFILCQGFISTLGIHFILKFHQFFAHLCLQQSINLSIADHQKWIHEFYRYDLS